ncbi:MAG TPA: PAS domain S-box protein [Acidimicrobiales bacterium]|nr:PAS domain S-box protein [Acidimicrobiales bacterium]
MSRSGPSVPDWLLWVVGGTGELAPARRARVPGWLFVVGALATLVVLPSSHLSRADAAGVIGLDAGGLGLGVALVAWTKDPSGRAIEAFLALGTLWTGALVYLLHSPRGSVYALFLWFAPVAFAVLPTRRAFGLLVLAAVVSAVLRVATHSSGASWLADDAGQWFVLTVTMVVLCVLVDRLARSLGQRDRLFRGAFDQWSVAMSITDGASRWLAVNPAASAMLGRSADELIGRGARDVLHPDDVESSEAARQELLRGEATTSVHEERYLRPDGSVVHALTTLSPIRSGPKGEPVVLGLAQDVTQQRRAEGHRLHLVRQLLRAQEQERARIADDVHDDPLQSIIAVSIQLQILASRVEDPAQMSLVEAMRRSTAASIEQLRALLFELHPPALQLGGLLESLREYLRRYEGIGGPKVRVEGHLDSDASPEEAMVLFRVAREALANVHKHAAASDVSVLVTEADGGVEVVVTDDGVGFDTGGENLAPGHVGLASARERAERVGGRVEVESSPGNGTRVRAWIPRIPS